MKFKGEFPSHFNSIKVPSIQYAKGSKELYDTHWVTSADSAVSACKIALLSAQMSFVAAQKTQVDSTVTVQGLCREAYSLINKRYKTRNDEGTYKMAYDLETF
jgi:hypothetical protein